MIRKYSFEFALRKDQPIVLDIYSFLEEMLGVAEEKNEAFHNNGIDGIEKTSDGKDIDLFRIIVSVQQLEVIKAGLLNLNVDFEQYFSPIKNHFHPYCDIGENNHEGIAYENENGGWDIYYTHGTVSDLLNSEEFEKYFFSVTWEDIEAIEEIELFDFVCNLFEKKVRELLKTVGR